MNVSERIDPVVGRCKSFLAATEPGHFLVRVTFPADAPPIPPIYSFDFDRQLEEYLDCLLANQRPGWAAKDGIDDDSIPSTCPRFGIAEHSAWAGTKVHLQENTSLPEPIIRDWADLDSLRLSEAAPWFQYMKKGYDYLRSRKDGTFLLSVRGTEMPMDLANALRGDDIFMDFLADKEPAHRLLAWCVTGLRWYYNHLLSWADEIDGGQLLFYTSSWLGPRPLGHVSNDAAMLCSREVYEEFGYPYEVQLMEGFGRLFYHVHTEKMHFLPKAATLPRLTFMEMTPDPKSPDPIEDLPNIFAHTGQAALVLYGNPAQLARAIEPLKQRNAFLTIRCKDRAEAIEVVRFVRKHSKPLK